MKNLFTKHPHGINETYFQHFWCALSFGTRMFIGGLAFMIHAFLPFLFVKTGSNFLLKTTDRYIKRTPMLDERIMGISQTLEKKIAVPTNL